MSVAAPATLDALVQAVANSAPLPLRIAGGGTTRPSPRDDAAGSALVLDMRRLAGLSAYDPAECVVTVLGGTPVRHLVEALAAHGQYLPWDPPIADATATVGGMIASGLSGPGRYRYGGVRDFVIGARFVDGRGRLIASGGQVVKNAAGFLMHHALVGSAGRLGVIAEVSLKVFPRPDATRTLAAAAPSLAEALAAHDRLRRANLDLDALDLDATSRIVSARLAGAADAIDARVRRAADALALDANILILSGADEVRHWHAQSLAAWPAAGAAVKVPATPSRLAATIDALTSFGPCRASAGGAVVYAHTTAALHPVDAACRAAGLTGAVVRGQAAGTRLGVPEPPAFHDRVRGTLDPDARFR